nr:hypothetical protein [Myxococcus dinghuensis]
MSTSQVMPAPTEAVEPLTRQDGFDVRRMAGAAVGWVPDCCPARRATALHATPPRLEAVPTQALGAVPARHVLAPVLAHVAAFRLLHDVRLRLARKLGDVPPSFFATRTTGERVRRETVVVIAHRLRTLQGADQILVLDQGRIVERGRHEALLAQDGLSARLWREHERARSWLLGTERPAVASAAPARA